MSLVTCPTCDGSGITTEAGATATAEAKHEWLPGEWFICPDCRHAERADEGDGICYQHPYGERVHAEDIEERPMIRLAPVPPAAGQSAEGEDYWKRRALAAEATWDGLDVERMELRRKLAGQSGERVKALERFLRRYFEDDICPSCRRYPHRDECEVRALLSASEAKP